jgi:hypothetical protein
MFAVKYFSLFFVGPAQLASYMIIPLSVMKLDFIRQSPLKSTFPCKGLQHKPQCQMYFDVPSILNGILSKNLTSSIVYDYYSVAFCKLLKTFPHNVPNIKFSVKGLILPVRVFQLLFTLLLSLLLQQFFLSSSMHWFICSVRKGLKGVRKLRIIYFYQKHR